ncbi:efflux RND transporter periplasmic adaptor subunit [Robiginitomaculum antarcticum]|uniref:efflux RND transporter periplasmic adaptor subunit n=1 Tax=Robiginitomaculum antarcticum TaxID=437507 RepID=UPI00036D76B3|nr:efflux RND transporter periplasmic adaptor subunit [Robiginitomaculum antarcticum]
MINFKHIFISASALTLIACQGSHDETGSDHGEAPSGQRSDPSANIASNETVKYTCPMHPHYISDDPNGSCPICGMDLVPVADSGPSTSSGKGKILYYKNPMGLPDKSSVPKKDSMGMDYIPVYENEGQGSGVAVSPEMIQTMGIRTVTVNTEDVSRDIRAYGTVEPNTRLESMSASRLEGWIDGLTVRAEGDIVRRGQRLYRIYTPELIAAQKDYLASLQIGNARRIASVRQRLKSKGMQEGLIDRLTTSREVIERMPVYAESAGVVTELMVRDGDYLKPGDPVMKLQSYTKVWVIASVPESELPQIQIGEAASLKFESAPDAPKTGTVDYIYPTIDSNTRTAKVRISVENASGSLRPGAYVDIVFETQQTDAPSSQLVVPSQAILRDSRGAHVIMALGDGRFESRHITIGSSIRGRTEILSGLTAGERIVSSGQFMLDSESSLREGLSKLSAPAANFDAATPLSQLPIDGQTLSEIDHIVDTALYFHEAIIDGYAIDPYFLDPTLALIDTLKDRFSGSRLSPILDASATVISNAKNTASTEPLASHLSRLMTALDPWLLSGAPAHYKSKGLILYKDRNTGRLWLQEAGLPANPYSSSDAAVVAWPDPMAGTTR